MPIDVGTGLQNLGQELRRSAGVFSDMWKRIDEAEQREQISSGSIDINTAIRKYIRELPSKRWDDADGNKGVRTLGALHQTEIEEDFEAAVAGITETLKKKYNNPRAAEQLSVMVRERAGASFESVNDIYNTHRIHESLSRSNAAIESILNGPDSPQNKKKLIEQKISDDVAAGIRWSDDAAKYLVDIKNKIDSSWVYENAVRVAGEKGWTMEGLQEAEKWIDDPTNTSFWNANPAMRQAAKEQVRTEVTLQRSIKQTMDREFDEKLEETLTKFDLGTDESGRLNWNSIPALREMVEKQLPKYEFRNESYGIKWADRYRNRIADLVAIEERKKGGDTSDPNNDSDNAILMELSMLKAAMYTGNLDFTPAYVSGMSESARAALLAPGATVTPKLLSEYIHGNFGAARNENGVLVPRIKVTTAYSELDGLAQEKPPAWEKLSGIIYGAVGTKDKPGTLEVSEAIGIENDVLQLYRDGKVKMDELATLVPALVVNATVRGLTQGDMPWKGNTAKIDTLEAVINSGKNGQLLGVAKFYERSRNLEKVQQLDGVRALVAKRMTEKLGKTVPIRDVGFIDEQGATYIGILERDGNGKVVAEYRFDVEKYNDKTMRYEDGVPILMKRENGAWVKVDRSTAADQAGQAAGQLRKDEQIAAALEEYNRAKNDMEGLQYQRLTEQELALRRDRLDVATANLKRLGGSVPEPSQGAPRRPGPKTGDTIWAAGAEWKYEADGKWHRRGVFGKDWTANENELPIIEQAWGRR